MLIEIINPEIAEPEALANALANTTRYFYDKVTIFVFPRKATGWLEYAIKFVFPNGSVLYDRMIQLSPGAEYVFGS